MKEIEIQNGKITFLNSASYKVIHSHILSTDKCMHRERGRQTERHRDKHREKEDKETEMERE